MGSLSGSNAAGHEEEQGLSVLGMDWSRLQKPPEKKQQQQADGELQQAQSLQHQSSLFGGVFRKQSMHIQQAPGSTTSATPPGDASAAASVQDDRSSFCTVDFTPEDQTTAAAAPTGAYNCNGAGQTDGTGFDVEEALAAAADIGHGEAQADERSGSTGSSGFRVAAGHKFSWGQVVSMEGDFAGGCSAMGPNWRSKSYDHAGVGW